MCLYNQGQKKSIYKWRARNPQRYLDANIKYRMRNYYWNKISREFNNILLDEYH